MLIKRSWILLGDSLAALDELALRWWPRPPRPLWPAKPSSFSLSFSVDSDCLIEARLPRRLLVLEGVGSSCGAEMETTGMGSSRFTSGSACGVSMAQEQRAEQRSVGG